MCVMSEECHSTVTTGADAMRNVALAAAAASDAVGDNSGSTGACGGGASKLFVFSIPLVRTL